MSPNWPKSVFRAFGIITPGNLESAWYPAWGAVLNCLFPFDNDYLISRDYGGKAKALTLSESGNLQAIDFTVTYIVERFNVPIFFVEVKVPADLKYPSSLFEELSNQEHVEVPFLYGISAMGTRMAVYKYDVEEGTMDPPPCMTKLKGLRSDMAPLINWSYDVLSDEGERKLRELVAETKNVVKERLFVLDTDNTSTFKAEQTQQMSRAFWMVSSLLRTIRTSPTRPVVYELS
ncbi:hypothetical protein K439DRAFT_1662146 [Ramaria rubella]|nr:hypothetical protein K439DRAFT_1662146 [Ramaria rubella]